MRVHRNITYRLAPGTAVRARKLASAAGACRYVWNTVLAGIPRIKGTPHVIPGKVPGAPLRNLDRPWQRIRARAGLGDVRLHDCRHSFASRALALGEGLPMIGRLLGHTRAETAARYAHLARDSVRRSAVRVADSIVDDVLSDGWRGADEAVAAPAS